MQVCQRIISIISGVLLASSTLAMAADSNAKCGSGKCGSGK